MPNNQIYKRAIWLLLTITLMGCSHTSTLQLKDGSKQEIEITGSNGPFVLGVHEDMKKPVKVLSSDIVSIEYAGESQIYYGARMTIFAGVLFAASAVYHLRSDPDRLAGNMSLLFGGISASIGVPLLTWGILQQKEARELGGWQEAMESIRPIPLVMTDGEKSHYGLALSGYF
jgi:hypothetical protein